MLEPKNWVGKQGAMRVGLGVCGRRGPAEAPACSYPVPEPCPSPLLKLPPLNLLLKLPALLQAPQPPQPLPPSPPALPSPVPLPTGCCVDTQDPELPRLGSPRSRHGDRGASVTVSLMGI